MEQPTLATTAAAASLRVKPKDLSHHLNAVTRARNLNAMKSLYKYFQTPGMANLAGGAHAPLLLRLSAIQLP